MRFSTITTLSGSALSVFVYALPAPEAAAVGAIFTSPGTVDGGFKIPEGATDGTYRTIIDNSGLAHHTKIAELTSDEPSTALGSSHNAYHARDTQAPKADFVGVSCAGEDLSILRDDADSAVRSLGQGCGGGYDIGPGVHFWSKSGVNVAFICNHSPHTITCFQDGFLSVMYDVIPAYCGYYQSGWADYVNPQYTIGQHWTGGMITFCNRVHNPYCC